MAALICPKCNVDSFSWSNVGENTDTIERCDCGCEEYEDESYERKCDSCRIRQGVD